jgi:hypothetical protein
MKSLYKKLPTTRNEALGNGSTYYFTGEKCIHGHRAPRYTSTRRCVQCALESVNRQRKTTMSNQIDQLADELSALRKSLAYGNLCPHMAAKEFEVLVKLKNALESYMRLKDVPFDELSGIAFILEHVEVDLDDGLGFFGMREAA